MWRRIGVLCLGMALLVGMSSFELAKERKKGKWERLGSKTVNFKVDRDVLAVGANDGTFKKLKIAVSGGNLNMHRMVVKYGNGTKDEIELRHNFGRAGSSRVIDLNGGKRIIKRITFVYDTKNVSRKRAKVHVFGRH